MRNYHARLCPQSFMHLNLELGSGLRTNGTILCLRVHHPIPRNHCHSHCLAESDVEDPTEEDNN